MAVEDNKVKLDPEESLAPLEPKVKLSDVMSHEDNPSTEMVSVKDYFSFLNTEMTSIYNDMELSLEVAQKLKSKLKTLRSGIKATVPIICPGGAKCPIVKSCPFAEWKRDGSLDPKSNFPLLMPCPIESSFLQFRIQNYIEEYSIHTASPSTMSLLNKLAELDVYDMRCDVILSQGDRAGEGADLMKEEVSALHQPTGDVHITLKIHPAFELKEKIHKQRMDLLDVLIGTPKAQFKANSDVAGKLKENDLALNMSKLRTRLDTINKAIIGHGAVTIDIKPEEE